MSIKRYRFYIDPDTHCFCEMEEIADGSYVAHEDYAELQAQLAETQKELLHENDLFLAMRERAEKVEAHLQYFLSRKLIESLSHQ